MPLYDHLPRFAICPLTELHSAKSTLPEYIDFLFCADACFQAGIRMHVLERPECLLFQLHAESRTAGYPCVLVVLACIQAHEVRPTAV
jgi:hypothetical protein